MRANDEPSWTSTKGPVFPPRATSADPDRAILVSRRKRRCDTRSAVAASSSCVVASARAECHGEGSLGASLFAAIGGEGGETTAALVVALVRPVSVGSLVVITSGLRCSTVRSRAC